MTCRHLGTCGGCAIAAPYDEQLEQKRVRLAGLLGVDVPPLIPSPKTDGFRQKAAFVFGSPPQGRGLLMGHYAAGTQRLVPVEECPVHSPRANRIAFALRDRLVRASVPAADQRGGILRHLIVRTTEDDREAVAMLVVTANDKSLRRPVKGLLDSKDAPDGFYVNINTRASSIMVGPETLKIAGRAQVRERGITDRDGQPLADYLVSPDAFFQTNVGAARQLVHVVLDAVPATGRILDLYCGSGLFSLPLVRRGATVTAIEENRTSIDDLQTNVRLNRLDANKIRPLAGRVEDLIGRLTSTRWDAVVLDPPREGCAPGVLPAVFERLAPPKAVYVSCDPDVLARDLVTIRGMGYAVDRVQAVDMFPHTDHIETVVALTRERVDGRKDEDRLVDAIRRVGDVDHHARGGGIHRCRLVERLDLEGRVVVARGQLGPEHVEARRLVGRYELDREHRRGGVELGTRCTRSAVRAGAGWRRTAAPAAAGQGGRERERSGNEVSA